MKYCRIFYAWLRYGSGGGGGGGGAANLEFMAQKIHGQIDANTEFE